MVFLLDVFSNTCFFFPVVYPCNNYRLPQWKLPTCKQFIFMKWCHDQDLEGRRLDTVKLLGIQCQCIIKMTSKELLWQSSITLIKVLMVTFNVQKPVFPQNRLLTFHLQQQSILNEEHLWILYHQTNLNQKQRSTSLHTWLPSLISTILLHHKKRLLAYIRYHF